MSTLTKFSNINLTIVNPILIPYMYKNCVTNFVKKILAEHNKEIIEVYYCYPITEALIISAVCCWFMENSKRVKNVYILVNHELNRKLLNKFNKDITKKDIWTLPKLIKIFIKESNRIHPYYPKFKNQTELDFIFNELLYLTNMLRNTINKLNIGTILEKQNRIGKCKTINWKEAGKHEIIYINDIDSINKLLSDFKKKIKLTTPF